MIKEFRVQVDMHTFRAYGNNKELAISNLVKCSQEVINSGKEPNKLFKRVLESVSNKDYEIDEGVSLCNELL